LKIALVHDWLDTFAGSEKVLESLYELYKTEIFTLIYNKENFRDTIFEHANIHTSFIQKLPFAKTKFRNYLPLFPFAIEQFDLSNYDIIISSSHAVAKGVLSNTNQIHISYIHTPIRYAWDLYFQYLNDNNLERGLRSFLVKYFLHKIRIWDYISSQRVDYFIANSNHVAKRVKKFYNRDAKVIYPPVDVDKFYISKKDDFYITISRLVPYKKVDLIVETFTKLKNKKLIVIGDGPQLKKIKSIATDNIEILGYQPDHIIKELLSKAKAFVFAAEEDFGILPVEAQASGTPVIAFKKGGVLETVIENKTGIFFDSQTLESLKNAIIRFEKQVDNFDLSFIRKHSLKFSKERFKKEIITFINEVIHK